jgi:hypothetical protein
MAITEDVITIGQLLEFEVAFPGEQLLTPEQYMSGGNRDFILNAAALFLGFKSSNSRFDDNRELLRMFFSVENNDFAQNVYNKVLDIEKTGTKVGIINTYSSLRLFECFFKTEATELTQTNEEFERNLFKAYLVLNSEFVKAQNTAFTSTEDLEGDFKLSMMVFCMQYPISDKSNYDITEIWATQAIKATYLFQFLENTELTKPLLKAFLDHFNTKSWQNYIKDLLPLTTSAISNKNEAHTDININPGEKFKEGCEFVEKLIVTEDEALDENDFLSLRAKPFYKIKNGVYRIIFNLFVVEKIFKGAYFLLRDINNKLPEDKKVMDLKGIYGHQFSEQTLVYKMMDIIYPTKCIRFTGKQLDNLGIPSAPDYYLRKGENILLLESKDFLIRADKKTTFDFNVYEEEIGKTLHYELRANGTKKPGAVLQLIKNIKRILKKDFTPDTSYHYKDVFIYPVLITHDHQYDTPGFNDLVNDWFQEELSSLEDEGLFINRVKPIVVVNIDSLIFHQSGLSQKIPLHEMLKLYLEYTHITTKLKFHTEAEFEQYKKNRMSKMIPFSLFIAKYFDKHSLWSVPPIMDVVAPALFAEEIIKNKMQ